MIQMIEEAKVKQKLLTMVGFAMRAGKLVCGTDKICDEIRRHGIPDDNENANCRVTGVVLLASDASENTQKRLKNACRYYHVEIICSSLTSDEIASRIGRAAAAACATFDKNFVEGINKAVGLTRENRRNRV